MKGQSVVFSTGKDDWRTPPDLFAALHREFQFTVDGAADARNHLLPRWWGPGATQEGAGNRTDALTICWAHERVFCNPPYSQIHDFVAAAATEATAPGMTGVSVLLIPTRTDTRWFHSYLWNRQAHRPYDGVELRFLKGRLKFLTADGPADSAPFPSMIAVLRPSVGVRRALAVAV